MGHAIQLPTRTVCIVTAVTTCFLLIPMFTSLNQESVIDDIVMENDILERVTKTDTSERITFDDSGILYDTILEDDLGR